MKTIFMILMLLIASPGIAHNKVVVIPMARDSTPECSIVGAEVECGKEPRARVAIGLSATCAHTNVNYEDVKYTENGKHIILIVGDTSDKPRIELLMAYEFNPSAANTIDYFSKVKTLSSGDYTLASGVTPGCSPPPVTQYNNLTVDGREWKVTPVFSSTGTTVTLDELIFELQ